MARSTQGRIQGRAKIGEGGGLRQESASSDWKATTTNQMYSNDLEACWMKCCYFLFHSKVNFLCVHCSQVSDSGLLGLLFYYGIKNWKELPRDIKECKRKHVFKTLVKQHLLDKGLSKYNKNNHSFCTFKIVFNCNMSVLIHYIMCYWC